MTFRVNYLGRFKFEIAFFWRFQSSIFRFRRLNNSLRSHLPRRTNAVILSSARKATSFFFFVYLRSFSPSWFPYSQALTASRAFPARNIRFCNPLRSLVLKNERLHRRFEPQARRACTAPHGTALFTQSREHEHVRHSITFASSNKLQPSSIVTRLRAEGSSSP